MTDGKADWRAHRYYAKDPLPEIAPALLNSADIERYINAGCLIEADKFDRNRMKPASYEMRFLGELYDWEECHGRLRQRHRLIREGKPLKLYKNSISYLWMEEQLLLPEYIAARFNLRIREVHKGLLLGTGPLIDPGFGGRILIPLHNLTDNDYQIEGGDGIIWVEFTKVSRNKYWCSDEGEAERPPELATFPDQKSRKEPTSYLDKAGVLRMGGVQSAFRGALRRAQYVAENAISESNKTSADLDEMKKTLRNWGILGALAVAIGVVAVVVSAFSLTDSVVQSQSDRIGELERRLEELRESQRKDPALIEDNSPNRIWETSPEALEAINSSENTRESE